MFDIKQLKRLAAPVLEAQALVAQANADRARALRVADAGDLLAGRRAQLVARRASALAHSFLKDDKAGSPELDAVDAEFAALEKAHATSQVSVEAARAAVALCERRLEEGTATVARLKLEQANAALEMARDLHEQESVSYDLAAREFVRQVAKLAAAGQLAATLGRIATGRIGAESLYSNATVLDAVHVPLRRNDGSYLAAEHIRDDIREAVVAAHEQARVALLSAGLDLDGPSLAAKPSPIAPAEDRGVSITTSAHRNSAGIEVPETVTAGDARASQSWIPGRPN